MRMRPLALPGLLLVLACPERSRLTGPTTGIGVGPEITITDPAQDVTLFAGTAIFIKGTAFDEEGVDSIFLNTGGNAGSLLAQPAGGIPRASFSIPLNLIGAAGDTVTITVYAANVEHVRGDLVTRRIQLR